MTPRLVAIAPSSDFVRRTLAVLHSRQTESVLKRRKGAARCTKSFLNVYSLGSVLGFFADIFSEMMSGTLVDVVFHCKTTLNKHRFFERQLHRSRRMLWETKTPGTETRKRIGKKARAWALAPAEIIRASRNKQAINLPDADRNLMKSPDKAEVFRAPGKASQIRVAIPKAGVSDATIPDMAIRVRRTKIEIAKLDRKQSTVQARWILERGSAVFSILSSLGCRHR